MAIVNIPFGTLASSLTYDVELVSIQLQILGQTVDSGISNVASVDESQQPKAKEPWNNVQIEFAGDSPIEGMIDVRNFLSFELDTLKGFMLDLFVSVVQSFGTGRFCFLSVGHDRAVAQ